MVKTFSLICTLAIPLSVILSSNVARGEKFYIKGATDSDTVTFKSEATLETVVGVTNNIVGFINFDPNKTDSVSGKLRVDARTLNTGIGMRDDDMRNDHLETNKFPYIEFKLTGVSGLPTVLVIDSTCDCQATGEFSLHGVTKTITVATKVVYRQKSNAASEKTVSIVSTFGIKLADYKVSRPKFLFLKLAEQVDITVKYTASTSYPPVELK